MIPWSKDYSWVSPRGAWGLQIRIQIWQYIPICPAIIPVYALFIGYSRGSLDLTFRGLPSAPLLYPRTCTIIPLHHALATNKL